MYQYKNANKFDFCFVPCDYCDVANERCCPFGIRSVFRFLKSPLVRVAESHVSCRDGRFCVTEKKYRAGLSVRRHRHRR